ncbi:MAG: DUF504 domain-containing protein [candidate division Zixibacteria bacterium]|nr:DUF504 domain-containing protein [candidate division Zixibacteria bacterium]
MGYAIIFAGELYMSKNPLRELLNRLIHDNSMDEVKAFIEYRDFEGENGVSEMPLNVCRIGPYSVEVQDTSIPFHRITKVTYDGDRVYPFDRINTLSEWDENSKRPEAEDG